MSVPDSAGATSALRVLVIDDDPRVQAAMTAELASVGWLPTSIGPQRLADLGDGELDDQFDVALVDVALPSVAAGLRVITDVVHAIPVVAFSISGAAREAALAAGAAAYLEKDGDTDRVLHVLRVATAHTTPAAASTAARPEVRRPHHHRSSR